MPIAAGQKIRASEINDISPVFAYVITDISVTSSTTLVTATGLACAVEANSLYAMDGAIFYTAGATGDIKVAITVPSGTTGHWGLHGVVTSSTANGGTEGDLNGLRQTAFGTGTTITAAGSANFSGRMMALPRGYIDTAGTAGNVQFMVAQNTSDATATVVTGGSWLRLWKLA